LKKNLEEMIPVSCFTATAKQNVINDILKYFEDKLGIKLELYTTQSSRKNLKFIVTIKQENEKYNYIRQLLSDKDCPTIIYLSRTRRVEEICEKLNKDGFYAKSYHGKMEAKVKSENQDAFIKGEVNIMVATSAFGMGVDKKDVTRVIHYDISDSLENYIQEAGRAGRDPKLMAECYILYNEDDLNKHFQLLNQSKVTIQEIQQVWKSIKNATKTVTKISHSALEIAREAGWDDNIRDIETRVITAIAALENAGYIE
jgi:ATP-dependent DNA helicase RecQ